MDASFHLRQLKSFLPEGAVLDAPEDVFGYSYDSQAVEAMPFGVCLPERVEEVSAVLKYCGKHGIPVTPRGAGSGTTGGSVPLCGGIALSLQRMNRIERIDEENFVATVQPGVITERLHKAVEERGLFYPPDPASMAFSTIGGNIAENSGGLRAVKYGVTGAYVLGLEVVLPNGDIIHTGSTCIKDVVGLNLAPLFVGSEGMLGVVTRAHLRLLPLPRYKKTMSVAFVSMRDAALAVTAIMRAGVVPCALEFLDRTCINAIESRFGLGLCCEAGGMLLVEVDGSRTQTEEDIATAMDVCKTFSLHALHLAANDAERERLWRARRCAGPSLVSLRPRKIYEDIVVPRASIPQMLERLEAISKRFGLPVASFGHAGDGNIHVYVMADASETELDRAHQAVEAIFVAASELDGRISGEHGIGLSKKSYLSLNVDRASCAMMKQLKQTLDPGHLLNPGKMFAEDTFRA